MMRRLILDDKQRVNEWVWPRIGRERPFAPDACYEAIGVEEDGKLIAGVVFDSFAKNARCSMHCAGEGKRWCSRQLLELCFKYAFEYANVNVVVNTVAADNADSIRFTKHVGFEEMCRIPGGSGDTDLIIFALHRDKCRWLGGGNV